MRTTLLTAALLFSGTVQAAPLPGDAPTSIAQAPAPKPGAPATSDDEDEDEAPKKATLSPSPGKEERKEEKSEAPNAGAAAATTAAPTTTQLKLISGAPLNNPNVGVHIVERKQFSDSGMRELVVYPAALQVNGKFTQHFGSMASFVWHLQENLGLQITGGYNWYNVESGFNGELVSKVHEEAQSASSLLWVWGVMGGVEAVPLYGKFAFFEGTLAHFSVVLSGGAGLGGTRHQLKPQNQASDGTVTEATYGDTGLRFMGSLGAGFRLQLGSRFALRLEVRDVVYTARVEQVNGCDANDLKGMDAAERMGKDPGSAPGLSASCRIDTFTGTWPGTSIKRANDVPLAYNLVKSPTSDVLNNVGLYLGAALLF